MSQFDPAKPTQGPGRNIAGGEGGMHFESTPDEAPPREGALSPRTASPGGGADDPNGSGHKRGGAWAIVRPILLITLWLVAGTELLYLVTMNAFLSSKAGAALLNASPDIVELRFGKLRSWIPFRVHAEDVFIRVQDGNIQMQVTADKAMMDIRPSTMFSNLTFTSTKLRADGVAIRIRLRRDPNEMKEVDLKKLPPIEGFASPILEEERPPPPDDAHYNLVSVDLRDIDARDVREVWVEDIRYCGRIDLRGGFYYKPLRKIRIDALHVESSGGTLLQGEKNSIADNISLKLDANLPELDVQHFRQKALGLADMAVKLQTRVKSASFINYYLKDIPEVRVVEGGGDISLVLDIKHGQIIAGSKLALDTRNINVSIPYFTIGGKGIVRWEARERTAWLDVKVKDIVFTEKSSGKVRLKGPLFNVTAVSSGLDLSKNMNLQLVMDLPDAHGDDLTFLSNFIPEGTGVTVKNGRGTVHGNVEIDAAKQLGRAALDIDGDDIEVRTRGATMKGRVKVRGIIPKIHLKTGSADFSGSHLTLDRATIDAEGRHFDNFWLKVATNDCKWKASKDLDWFARLDVGFQSLFPIMSVVSANIPVPWVLKAFSDLRDVHITSTLRVHPTLIDIDHLLVTSGMLRLDADLRLREKDKSFEPYGALMVHLGAIPIGVGLEGKKATPILANSEAWFTNHRIRWEQGERP
jgi:hypothetical protein